jgi:crotonobetainyl-CoA:carnitine CoA-transferase CaiB-like acyl-CoA transferase
MSLVRLLSGIRVLDLAGESAVLAARLLADLGADVIRVEPPGGDSVRRRAPFFGGVEGLEASLHHLHYNRNKRSVALDLREPAGRQVFLRLAETADVVFETAAHGEMDAAGVGWEALRTRNQGLVYVSVTPFGQSGPFRDYSGCDLIGAASSGFLYLNGFPEDPPNLPAAEQVYKMASLVAASSALIALVGRQNDESARGRRIDVSVQEAASMATLQTANANIYTWHGRVPRRIGNTAGVHQCRDGKWLSFVLRVGAQETWSDFVQWLIEEDIDSPITADAWRDEAFRSEHRTAVSQAIASLCMKHDRGYLFHEGQRRKQLVMPVNTVADLLEDEQLKQRSFFATIEHPEIGRTLVDAGLPYRFSGLPAEPSRRAPLLGEDNDDLLRDVRAGRTTTSAKAAELPLDPTRPLAGVRVADFSWMIAGPAASRVLADLGAEIIKIESEYRLDNIRVVGVQPGEGAGIDTNGVFNDCNTNKKSLRLNVNHPRGLEVAKDLIRRSDIVLNNYTADRMPRWGLGYEDLRALKRDIILLSMPVMGCTGPYKNYGSYGNGIVAFSGLNMLTGFPERPPIGLGPLYSDFAGPYFVVTALMAALHYRNRTGEGQFIDFSQVEATVNLLGPAILEYSANGGVPRREGNRSPHYAPHGVYRCRGEDRWLALAVATDEEWRTLCDAMEKPHLATDPRFARFEGRKKNEDALDELIEVWTRHRDAWDLMRELQGRALVGAVVEDLEDMCIRDPVLSTEHLQSVQTEGGLIFRTHAQPLRLDGQQPSLRAAPRFGEHSEEVLKSLLGLSDEEIERLLIDGAVY